jgi:hypothetical protein
VVEGSGAEPDHSLGSLLNHALDGVAVLDTPLQRDQDVKGHGGEGEEGVRIAGCHGRLLCPLLVLDGINDRISIIEVR